MAGRLPRNAHGEGCRPVIVLRMVANPGVLGLLERQYGLITAAQAAVHGLPGRTLRRRVAAEGWQRPAPRVFLAAGHPITPRTEIGAAALWAGDRGAVSGPAAAWWTGMLDRPPQVTEVTVPRRSGLRPYPGVRVRRRDLSPTDVVGIGYMRFTAGPLTALETAIAVPEGSVFLDRALQRHVTFPTVYRAYCRNMGADGAARIGVLLTAAANRADSAAERLLIAILRAAGLTGWERGRPFGPWTIDVAFPDAQVAVEVDGWAWHMDVDRFRADRHKGNALVRARWDLLRFTWHDLTHRPDYVLGEIRAALAAAARP
ncbi:type IV toxin-antitoxin system AbiEi family antitoxin domain-containing protein [Pseudonocardia petroleophila]